MKPINKADVARAYGKVGFNIFPCHHKNKIPLIKNNLRRATHDLRQIAAWWSAWPNARIGLPCESNQLLVLDLDMHKKGYENCLKDLAAETGLDLVAHPYRVKSASGGLHLYYKAPGIQGKGISSGTNVLGNGVDVRASGGFIIAADGEDYVLLDDTQGFNPETLRLELPALPAVLSKLLLDDRVEPVAEPDREYETFQQEWPRIRGALEYISAHNRDVWLKVGMAIHHASDGSGAGFGLWVRWSQTSEKFNGREQYRTWSGFEKRQV